MKYYYLKRHPGIFYYSQHGKRKYGFRFSYYDNQHNRHEKSKRGYLSLKNAISSYGDLVERQQTLENTNNMTFAQWSYRFLKALKTEKKVTTYKNYEHLLVNDAIPYIGNIKLIDLKPISYRYRCLMALIKRGLSITTIKEVNTRVQTVINDAVENTKLPKNNLKGVNLRHIKIHSANVRPSKQIMNRKQLRQFNKCLNRHSLQLRTIFYSLEYTGMRAGELMGLHWKDVDLNKRIININWTRDDYGIRTPKTEKSKRIIMIPSNLSKLLGQYYRVCQNKYKVSPKSLVIRGKHGNPLIPNLIPSILRNLLVECGLKNMVGRFTPHSFRHMLVSRLIGRGVNPVAVSKMMGHASVRITLDVYAQTAPGQILDPNKIFHQHYR